MWVQLAPPSVDLYMPSPVNVRPPPDGFASPVPTYSVPLDAWSIAPIVCVTSFGQTGEKFMPPSELFQMPPPDVAT